MEKFTFIHSQFKCKHKIINKKIPSTKYIFVSIINFNGFHRYFYLITIYFKL